MTQAESADQPALGPDGQLLNTSKIVWYNDPDDPHPIQSTSRVQEGEVLNFITILRFSFTLQVKLVNAHGQSMPPLVPDSQKPLPLRNSMSMGHHVVTSFFLVMQKCLLNASDPPLMTRMASAMLFKLIPIWRTRPSRFLFPTVDVMTTHRTQTAMKLKSEMKRYGSLSLDFGTN
jgi:hypothetical protein